MESCEPTFPRRIVFVRGTSTSTPRHGYRQKGESVPVTIHDVITLADVDLDPGKELTHAIAFKNNEFVLIHEQIGR